MNNLLEFQNFYLMGIKGVAMTSLAQILIDAGKTVSGCDVKQKFVTQKILDKLQLKIDFGFAHNVPADTDVVVYTSAHGGPNNPIVLQAQEENIPTVSQAEALAYFFNQKDGTAVCGVGGKSTVTAMTAWILNKTNQAFSFSVGVGKISGMDRTGRWEPEAQYFIAEADEYVIDPAVDNNNEEIVPRFSFLEPKINVCTNLQYDHPDVYLSIGHTQRVFANFLLSTRSGGAVIFNHSSEHLKELIENHRPEFEQKKLKLISYGIQERDQARLIKSTVENQTNIGKIEVFGKQYQLELSIPGDYNLMNALAAILAAHEMGVEVGQAAAALKDFYGTQRRFERKGEKNGVIYYDDYAHHPHEIEKTIQALRKWHPKSRRVVAFQPHTFSRTKQLLTQFTAALGTAQELLLLDIFPSAREQYDPEISSDVLLEKIKENHPDVKASNLKTVDSLADYCQNQLNKGDVLITMGAGDINRVYKQLDLDQE